MTSIVSYEEFLQVFLNTPFFSVKQSQDLPVYYREFSRLYNRPNLTILEFGVAGGGSLHFYRSILGAGVRIIGVDLNPNCLKLEEYGFEIFIGDQSDPIFMSEMFQKIGMVDIIIEDGGHTNFQQINTIRFGLPYVNDGGVMLIDDVHCSYHPRWGNPSKWSTINYLKTQITDMNYRSTMINRDKKPGIFSKIVESITFYEALVAIKVDRQASAPGNLVCSKGKNQDYSEDFRYHGNALVEKIYRVSKIVETRSLWVGKLAFIMNFLIKKDYSARFLIILIRATMSVSQVLDGRGTKQFFK